MALKKSFSRSNLIEAIGDQNIFEYYFEQEINLNKCYQSVLRDDKNYSTGFYLSKNGHLIYNDFSTGEKLDCVAFVAKKFGVNYYKATTIIAVDFGLATGIKSSNREAIIVKRKPLDKQERIIKITASPYSEQDLAFWQQFYITPEELKANNIYAVNQLCINDWIVPRDPNEISFAYLLKTTSKSYLKIYSPYSKEWKWVSSIPLNKPFGMSELKCTGKTLFITKGLKDMIILKKFFPDVIATQNESKDALTEEDIEKLKSCYSTIIIWYDCDKAGKFAAEYFKTEHGFISIVTPDSCYEKHGIKDLSDFVKHFGLDTFKQYLQWLKLL